MAHTARKNETTEPGPMSLDELWAIRGTPEFNAEYRRQMERVAEHDRRTNHADRWEPDWAALENVWK